MRLEELNKTTTVQSSKIEDGNTHYVFMVFNKKDDIEFEQTIRLSSIDALLLIQDLQHQINVIKNEGK